jgi:AraC-like DNA-binding protein
MSIGYQEFRPSPPLAETVLAFWSVAGEGSFVPSPTILPDAYVEIVLNLGDPVELLGSVFAGRQPDRVVVGLLERAIPMRYGKRVRTFGIRLHPARASGFLGVPAARIANTLTPLATLNPGCDAGIAAWLRAGADPDSTSDRAALEQLLAEQRQLPGADHLVVEAVDRLLAAEHPLAVVDIARQLGVTPRHLHRRFVATVGTPPKRLERLARFARTWQHATMGPPLGWAELAYANGYADQAHLVREFRAFGATPPAHLFTPEWYEETTIRRASGATEQVRFVQSSKGTADSPSTHRTGAPTTPVNRRKSR